MKLFWQTAAAFVSGGLGGMGMGGGGVLLLCLTLFAALPQRQAQGINLLFFVPIAVLSLFFHWKNGLIRWKLVWPAVLAGLPGALLGARLAHQLSEPLLTRLFALLLAVIGVRELLVREEPGDRA